MYKNKIHLAIIDDGVCEVTSGTHLSHDLVVAEHMDIQQRGKEILGKSHGTVCSAIIKKYCKEEISTSSIKILGDNHTGKADSLIKALSWCIENHIDVVNISLGSKYLKDRDRILKKINEAYYYGIIMVCAGDNGGFLTYPASFANVIGVCCSQSLSLGEGQWIMKNQIMDGIEIEAFSNHQISWADGTKELCGNYNSFAAPMITSIVINIWNQLHTKINGHIVDKLEVIREKLNNLSIIDSKEIIHLYCKPDWIYRAVIIHVGEPIDVDMTYDFHIIFRKYIKNEVELSLFIEKLMTEYAFDIDTLIIYSRNGLYKHTIEAISLITSRYGKSVIYGNINNQKNNYINTKGKKNWLANSMNSTEQFCPDTMHELKIPFIALFGSDKLLILITIKRLIDLFMKDDYIGISFSNVVEGIFFNSEYILPHLLNTDINKVLGITEQLSKKMCASICMLGYYKPNNKQTYHTEGIYDMHIHLIQKEASYTAKLTVDNQEEIIINNTSFLIWNEELYMKLLNLFQ